MYFYLNREKCYLRNIIVAKLEIRPLQFMVFHKFPHSSNLLGKLRQKYANYFYCNSRLFKLQVDFDVSYQFKSTFNQVNSLQKSNFFHNFKKENLTRLFHTAIKVEKSKMVFSLWPHPEANRTKSLSPKGFSLGWNVLG